MPTRGPYDSGSPSGPPRTLAERIRFVRFAWGWTQGELGAALNTDQTAVSAWERDKSRPSGAALAALAQLFGTSTESLESGQDFQPKQVPNQPPPRPQATEGRNITLPNHGSASAMLLDLPNSQTTPLLDSQEAILRIIQAGREGRKLWIVVE
ncbi:helix-turn-helix domain-containing protein [Geothrix fermentans]|uniref:helix-turn-helix transcriptional regulator n=1 Tax=Geothrix fermentans TaxID=44676 RepID=UPI0009FD3BE9